jgi:hypothetical protein
LLIVRIRRRFWIYFSVGAAVAAFLGLLIHDTAGMSDQSSRLAPFVGYILITIGWIVTSEVNIGNSRRQHTITLITQHAFDPQRAANRDIIKQTLPSFQSKLHSTLSIYFDDETSALLKAIDLELNFYEFLAVGAATGNLDESLIKQSLGSQFMAFYVQVEAYITHWRAKNDKTWRELSLMYTRWLGV